MIASKVSIIVNDDYLADLENYSPMSILAGYLLSIGYQSRYVISSVIIEQPNGHFNRKNIVLDQCRNKMIVEWNERNAMEHICNELNEDESSYIIELMGFCG